MSIDPNSAPSNLAGDSDPASDSTQSEARTAFDKLMVEARRLVVEMRRLLREQRQRER